MSDLTVKRDVRRQPGEVFSLEVEESTKILEGALVSANAAGYAVNAADIANTFFIGVADETCDNSAGADGAKKVKIRCGGIIDVAVSDTISQANIMDPVYVVDNQTVGLAATTTNDVPVGRIVKFVSANKARVALVNPGR